jgi:hypothetical protein
MANLASAALAPSTRAFNSFCVAKVAFHCFKEPSILFSASVADTGAGGARALNRAKLESGMVMFAVLFAALAVALVLSSNCLEELEKKVRMSPVDSACTTCKKQGREHTLSQVTHTQLI